MKKILVLSIIVLLLITALFAGLPGCTSKEAITLNVSAAASLTDALKEINALYTTQEPDVTITTNFASSGTIQQQIQNGAPVDVFISAAAMQMDNLQKDQLILDETRKNLLNNNVVLIVLNDSKIEFSGFIVLLSEEVSKIAMGDPKFVPAGTYAQQALEQLGIATQIQPKIVLCTDVRQILTYVESGNVDAGVLYSTDALTSDKVKVVGHAPAEVNSKVVYPVAVIKASKNAGVAKVYEDFLFSDQAKLIFEKYGFSMAIK